MCEYFEAFCHDCKKNVYYMGANMGEAIRKAHDDGWSPTGNLCCACLIKYQLEE